MGEWWANVYLNAEGYFALGYECETRQECDEMRTDNPPPTCRIHVRLKPEGAPKRYVSEDNREAWETDAKACRKTMRTFGISATSIRPDAPRTPKIEERT